MKERHVGADAMRSLERLVALRVVDDKWMEHLDAMDQMRQGIGLRAIGQRDPLVEYKHEAFDMFGAMIAAIQEEIVRIIYYARLVEQPKERRNVVAQHDSMATMGEGADGRNGAGRKGAGRAGAMARAASGGGVAIGHIPGAGSPGRSNGAGGQGGLAEMAGPKQQPAVSSKVGRNDLCPCGSGLKYKKCCGKGA
jgi:preprotein translocase subunit SecA